MGSAAIRISDVEKTFHTDDGQRVPVLDGLDLTVEHGEFLCILGPTGCGKTTLLRLLTGLTDASGGEIEVSGSPPGAEGKAVGMVFQQNSLLPWRRVIRNVSFPLELGGMPRKAAAAKARELLRLVRLAETERAYPYELSGGMQQRAAIARALAAGGDILFLDEPFGALDEQTRRMLQDALLDIWKETCITVLFVTHNIEEAVLLGSRILVLGKGRALTEEQIDLPHPRDRFSAEFVDVLTRLRRAFADAIG